MLVWVQTSKSWVFIDLSSNMILWGIEKSMLDNTCNFKAQIQEYVSQLFHQMKDISVQLNFILRLLRLVYFVSP